MPKCSFNKVAKQNTSGQLLLEVHHIGIMIYYVQFRSYVFRQCKKESLVVFGK